MISVQEYHNRTKHRFNAYAKGPETLDWDDQPYAFRRFEGCEVFPLPMPGKELSLSWANLTSGKDITPAPLSLESIGMMLELAFGLAAWKQYGPDMWAVRCNPSSGNLHPSEAYIINGTSDCLPEGVYHYVSYDHYLEQRCKFEDAELDNGLWLGLSSVHWREAWKYGERAFRYCQLDAGHALAALEYAASSLGWRIELKHDLSDEQIAHILGTDRHDEFVKKEGEVPDWFCRIDYAQTPVAVGADELVKAVNNGQWLGKAASLKAYHMYHWKVIDEVTASTFKQGVYVPSNVEPDIDNATSNKPEAASKLIRKRRSAQRYQPDAAPVSADAFARMLSAVKKGDKPPYRSWNLGCAVHLVIFVHKVEGLAPGLYCLPRSSNGKSLLESQMNSDFLWQAQKEFPGLYLLHKGDTRQTAKSLSCFQAIASDGAFSLGMLCEFKSNIEQAAWLYRRLFWECGVIGQVLYMEAEAEGLRGTGIGCFFDDEVHQVLGMDTASSELQSLYHFTVGTPIIDDRIQTLPPYYHLQQKT